jgi:hypothetical protein
LSSGRCMHPFLLDMSLAGELMSHWVGRCVVLLDNTS